MLRDGNVLPQCKFAAFQQAVIQACDNVGDGVADGVIGDPLACVRPELARRDEHRLRDDHRAGRRRRDEDRGGPTHHRRGVSLVRADLGLFVQRPALRPRQHGSTSEWHDSSSVLDRSGSSRDLVQQMPPVGPPFNGTWDWTTTTYDQYDQLFQQSIELFSDVIGTDDPDLTAFKEAGGKIVDLARRRPG